MSESQRALLRQFLLSGYSELKAKLTQRFGSAALASDVLQDTWLRLEQAEPVGPVRYPKAYVFRMAFNIALKRKQAESESVTLDDAMAALLADEAPDPSTTAEGRSDLALLQQAVGELTRRQQEILFASRLDNIPLAELAVRYGISQRWVERELRHAVLHCARRLDRKIVQRFGPQPREGSLNVRDGVGKGRDDDDAR
ncbi:MAG: sigma-70 family RNA polymerase sigma factor [Pseudomonadota bacterium]